LGRGDGICFLFERIEGLRCDLNTVRNGDGFPRVIFGKHIREGLFHEQGCSGKKYQDYFWFLFVIAGFVIEKYYYKDLYYKVVIDKFVIEKKYYKYRYYKIRFFLPL
jgi:hypothetical protein